MQAGSIERSHLGLTTKRDILQEHIKGFVKTYQEVVHARWNFHIDAADFLNSVLEELVEQFVGRWSVLPQEAQACLGRAGVLGETALVGARVWQRDLRVRQVLSRVWFVL